MKTDKYIKGLLKTYVVLAAMFAVLTAGASPHPEGTWKNPWRSGESGEVYAYIDGVGRLRVEGTGAVTTMPWVGVAGEITELEVGRGVTGLAGIVGSLPNLKSVNGVSVSELGGMVVGAVKPGGFTAISVNPATKKAKLTLVIKTAVKADADEKDWKVAATTDVEVDASAPSACYMLAPAK